MECYEEYYGRYKCMFYDDYGNWVGIGTWDGFSQEWLYYAYF